MPFSYAESEDGVVLTANGFDPVLRWDGYAPTAVPAGLVAPTLQPILSGGGTGALKGTYQCMVRFVDAAGFYSNPTPFSDQVSVTNVGYFQYANLPAPPDAKAVRRQVLRNTTGQSETFYVDIDTTDVSSPTLTSTRTDASLSTQEAQTLFDQDGLPLYLAFGPPPGTVTLLAPHLNHMFGTGSADYSEGSVAVARGSPTVVGSSAAWKASMVGRFLHVRGADKPYEIAAVDAAASVVTLAEAYQGPTDRYAAYSIRPEPAAASTLFFSEANLPESWPAYNGQTFGDDGDSPTALMATNSFLFVAKRRSTLKFTANSDPRVDGFFFPSINRGCVNNRTWVRVGDILYIMDEQGVYSFDGSAIQHLSTPVQDLFRGTNRDGLRVNWACSRWFHGVHCPAEETVRFFVTINGGYLPRYAVCFAYRLSRWWLEEYPFGIGASCLGYLGSPAGRWGRTPEQVFVSGPANRIYAIGPGALDGVAAFQPEYEGPVVSASPVTLTTPGGVSEAVVGAPVSITGGRGRDQVRLIAAVRAGGVIEIDRPWLVTPDATSRYLVGAVPYAYKTHRLEYSDSDEEDEFSVVLGFEPQRIGTVQARLYADHAAAPARTAARMSPEDREGLAAAAGEAGVSIDLTKRAGYATLRDNRHREQFTPGDRSVRLELRGHSGPTRHTFTTLEGRGLKGGG